MTPQPPGCPVSLNRLVSKPESRSLLGGLCVHAKSLSRVRLCVTPRAVARQATWNSPSKNTGVGFSALLQGNLPNPGIEPASLMSPALAGRFFPTSATHLGSGPLVPISFQEKAPHRG